MIHNLEIKEPIWKTRSVGVSILNMQQSDIVHMTVLYKNVDGEKTFPYTYELTALEISNYPLKYKAKGVPLYDVPIKNFRIINQTIINPQKQTNMLFNANEIKKLSEENKERSGVDSRVKIPMGENVLSIIDITIAEDKSKNLRLVIEVMKDTIHRNIKEGYRISGENSQIDKSRLIEFFERAFHYVIQPCQDEKDLVAQLKKFVGKRIKAAVRYEMGLYNSKDGENLLVRYPKLWYVTSETDTAFKVDINKCIKPLNKKDMDRVNALREMGHEVRDPEETPKATANTPNPTILDKDSDLPF
jgi:hypothetical protein